MYTPQFDIVTTGQAIAYLGNKYNKLNKPSGLSALPILTILKLLFLADRYSLRTYSKMVSNDKYYAMKKGPVASVAYNILKGDFKEVDTLTGEYKEDFDKTLGRLRNGVYPISSLTRDDLEYLSDSDIEALDIVFKKYGKMSEQELIKNTHNYPEWTRHKKSLDKSSSKREEVLIKDFFEEGPKDSLARDIPLEVLNARYDYFIGNVE